MIDQMKVEFLEFLNFIENNYYFNSGCWINCETDEVEPRNQIFNNFLNQNENE